jgi:hypothetical protein
MVKLSRGDRLFTDGITEASEPPEQEFGEESLAASAKRNGGSSAAELNRLALAEVTDSARASSKMTQLFWSQRQLSPHSTDYVAFCPRPCEPRRNDILCFAADLRQKVGREDGNWPRLIAEDTSIHRTGRAPSERSLCHSPSQTDR